MSRTVDLTVTLKLELVDDLCRDTFFDNLESRLRKGLDSVLSESPDCLAVVRANDPLGILSQEICLEPMLAAEGEVGTVWTFADVLKIRPDLTREQAISILEDAEDGQHAGIGIDWNTLEFTADQLFGLESPSEINS